MHLMKETPEQQGLPLGPQVRHKPHPNTRLQRESLY